MPQKFGLLFSALTTFLEIETFANVFNVLFDWSNVHIIYSGFSSFTWTFKPPPTSPLYQSLASSNSLSLRGNRGWGVWKLQAVPLVQLSMCVSMVCCCLWYKRIYMTKYSHLIDPDWFTPKQIKLCISNTFPMIEEQISYASLTVPRSFDNKNQCLHFNQHQKRRITCLAAENS